MGEKGGAGGDEFSLDASLCHCARALIRCGGSHFSQGLREVLLRIPTHEPCPFRMSPSRAEAVVHASISPVPKLCQAPLGLRSASPATAKHCALLPRWWEKVGFATQNACFLSLFSTRWTNLKPSAGFDGYHQNTRSVYCTLCTSYLRVVPVKMHCPSHRLFTLRWRRDKRHPGFSSEVRQTSLRSLSTPPNAVLNPRDPYRRRHLPWSEDLVSRAVCRSFVDKLLRSAQPQSILSLRFPVSC